MKKRTSNLIESIFILLLFFILIIVIFAGLNFGFKKIKSITGNSVSEDIVITNNYLEWIIITVISTIFVVIIMEYIIKKRLFRINRNLDYFKTKN